MFWGANCSGEQSVLGSVHQPAEHQRLTHMLLMGVVQMFVNMSVTLTCLINVEDGINEEGRQIFFKYIQHTRREEGDFFT